MIVYTCITGNYEPARPVNPQPGFEYLLYTDNPDIHAPGWTIINLNQLNPRIRLVRDGVYHPALTNRAIKIYPWSIDKRFLGIVGPFIYVDGSFKVKDLAGLVELIGKKRDMRCIDFALVRHWKRNCLYQEAAECLRLNKEDPRRINDQIAAYQRENVPTNMGLYECGFLLRNNTEQVMDFCERWIAEVINYSYRDQISFPYVLNKLDVVTSVVTLEREELHRYLPKRNHR